MDWASIVYHEAGGSMPIVLHRRRFFAMKVPPVFYFA